MLELEESTQRGKRICTRPYSSHHVGVSMVACIFCNLLLLSIVIYVLNKATQINNTAKVELPNQCDCERQTKSLPQEPQEMVLANPQAILLKSDGPSYDTEGHHSTNPSSKSTADNHFQPDKRQHRSELLLPMPSSFSRSQVPVSTKCLNAFFDLGANRGDSIIKFFSPFAYRSPFARFLQAQKWNPKEFCVFAFEGNPIFNASLTHVEKTLNDKFKLLEIYRQTVVVADEPEGPVPFYLDITNARNNFWGSSLLRSHPDVTKSGKLIAVTVKGVNLGRFVEERVDPQGIVVVKMDIEGAEYSVLRDLLVTGRLCQRDKDGNNLFDYMNVEFHSVTMPFESDSAGARGMRAEQRHAHRKSLKRMGNGLQVGAAKRNTTGASGHGLYSPPHPEALAATYQWLMHSCGVSVSLHTD